MIKTRHDFFLELMITNIEIYVFISVPHGWFLFNFIWFYFYWNDAAFNSKNRNILQMCLSIYIIMSGLWMDNIKKPAYISFAFFIFNILLLYIFHLRV